MVRQLCPDVGQVVVEIGTGSGYSTAVHAEAVGPTGRAVTVDVDSELLGGARQLLSEDGYTPVELIHADGRTWVDDRAHADGRAWVDDRASADGLIAWAQLPSRDVPDTWTMSARTGERAVLPMANEDRSVVVTLVRSTGGFVETGRMAAGFIPLTSTPLQPWEQ